MIYAVMVIRFGDTKSVFRLCIIGRYVQEGVGCRLEGYPAVHSDDERRPFLRQQEDLGSRPQYDPRPCLGRFQLLN